MKVVGLITEYNPFHYGHQLHIEEAKKITNANYVIVVMSGNFVQRGTPALMDKYLRTKIALEQGADIVIELPVCYATASAEAFAHGAISILEKISVVDSICFGSECGDINKLSQIADILLNESEEFKDRLAELLKSGMTYPAARSKAYMEDPKLKGTFDSSLLNSPNNILGIEYIEAIHSLDSKIVPYTIKRQSSGYHDLSLDSRISSASAIRDSIVNTNTLDLIRHHVPENSYAVLENHFNRTLPIHVDDFGVLLQYKLLLEDRNSLSLYQDVNLELANRIIQFRENSYSFTDLSHKVKSKQITLTRVNRCLLHILLNMKKVHFNQFKENGYSQYVRLLGFRKEASKLIRTMKDNDRIPIITKMANIDKTLSELGSIMLKQDILAANLYNKIVYDKFHTTQANEYTHGVIIHE